MKEYRARTWRSTNPPDEIVDWLNQMAREGFELVSSGSGTFIVSREFKEPVRQVEMAEWVATKAREFVRWPPNTADLKSRVGGEALIKAVEMWERINGLPEMI